MNYRAAIPFTVKENRTQFFDAAAFNKSLVIPEKKLLINLDQKIIVTPQTDQETKKQHFCNIF